MTAKPDQRFFVGRHHLAVAVLLGGVAVFGIAVGTLRAGKTEPPRPDHFLIGRRTYFDFGPPSEFYEVFSARTAGDGGTLIERIQLTPPGDLCTQSAMVETATASIKESVSELLGKTNPCAIPARDLNREIKRCKNCLHFSGADVVMQVACGSENRRIRMEVLDKDMFDANAGTPEHTSWTMKLLGRLDRVLGSTIMDRPIFGLGDSAASSKPVATPLLSDLQSGVLDGLFGKSTYTPSGLFRESRVPPPKQTVDLAESSPARPVTYDLPKYPPIARVAHVSGLVKFVVKVEADGHTSSPVFSSGNPILQKAVATSVADWLYPVDMAGQDINAAIEFNMNCQQNKP